MTEVLPASLEGSSHFSRPLRRSSSAQHNLFLATDPSSYIDAIPKSSAHHTEYAHRVSSSAPSSAPSSPQFSHSYSTEPSYPSTPASSLSLDTKSESGNTDIDFPSFDGPDYFGQEEELELPRPSSPPPSSPISNDVEPAITPSGGSSISEPVKLDTAEVQLRDDNTIENEPTRHVDYLSHDWKEEEIWSSWRYVVSKRGQFSNGVRLENASWRTWTKAKYRLRTVSPEKLNWLKDCDVTWLYGPLQCAQKKHFGETSSPPPSRLSKSNSFLNKKPILKKRSASEAILQRSLSAHTLLKHAGAILQAQEASSLRSRPSFNRSRSDFTPGTPTPTGESSVGSAHPSSTSSGLQSPPDKERRHITFNSEVSQCIAVEAKEDDDEELNRFNEDDDDDGAALSDDNLLMMKDPDVSHKARLSNRSTPRSSFSTEKAATIAPLPSARLRGETPEPGEASASLLKQAASFWTTNKTLKASPSEETLRPSKSANFLIDDEEDDLNWAGPSPTRSNNGFSLPTQQMSTPDSSSFNYQPGPGLRRTPSGMFMPYEEDEDDVVAAGLFGRVVDTVNTARDIAHVIWNVGWRR